MSKNKVDMSMNKVDMGRNKEKMWAGIRRRRGGGCFSTDCPVG